MGKKYLLITNIEEKKEITIKFLEFFMKKAFLTDSELFVNIHRAGGGVIYNYQCYNMRKVFCRTCRINFFAGDSDIEKTVQGMSAIIPLDYSLALPYIQAAIKFNVPILGFGQNDLDIPVSEEIENIKIQCENFFQQILQKCPPDEYEYFLFHEGTGESMAVYFWMKEYRKHHSKKILFICFNDLRFEMMNTCPYIDTVAKVPPAVFDYISVYKTEEFKIKRSLLQHFAPHSIEMQKKDPSYGIIEKMRDFLEIDPSLKIFECYPVKLPQESIDKAKKLFREMNLTEGKVVIILPEGYAYSGFSDKYNFWVNLAKRLKSEGYEILTNTEKIFIEGVRNLYMKTFDTSAFLGLCGNIISSPTGFIESLCTWNEKDKINWAVVVPNEKSGFWKSENPKAECENFINYYPDFVSKFAGKNLNQKVFKWGMNEAEDAEVIEKIVAELKSSAITGVNKF